MYGQQHDALRRHSPSQKISVDPPRAQLEQGTREWACDGSDYYQTSGAQTANLDGLAPLGLETSSLRWDRKPMRAAFAEIVGRKVTSLLNKLTVENFDSISDQIIAWANESKNESDGRTLLQVARMVFEKAIDEDMWSEMYARLCGKMMDQINSKVQEDGIPGARLFRRYLLNKCQDDFESGWKTKEAIAKVSSSKAEPEDNQSDKEKSTFFSDEYYAARKAKRQGLGLIKFIGELFKLQLLTERAMHECIKKFLANFDNLEDIETLCKLLLTVGAILDLLRAKTHMDVYFSRMKELTKSPHLTQRVRFMLQDMIELRGRRWTPRRHGQLHPALATAEAANGAAYTLRPQPKAGNLSVFGKITTNTKGRPLTFATLDISTWSRGPRVVRAPFSMTRPSLNPFMMPENAGLVEKSENTHRMTVILKFCSDEPKVQEKPGISKKNASKKIQEDIKEFFAVKEIDESYFTDLPIKLRCKLVEEFTCAALEKKETDVKLLAKYFAHAVAKGACSFKAFEEGLGKVAEIVFDVVIDAPKALHYFAIIVKSVGLKKGAKVKIASRSEDSDRLLALFL